jgi:hypothetical protein
LSNEHFPISEPKADRGLLPDNPKTSRIEDKTVSAAESFSGLPENPLAEPTSIC